MEKLTQNLLSWKEELTGKRGCLKAWPKDIKNLSISDLRGLRDAAEMWLSFPSNYRWKEDKDWCIEELLSSINKQLDVAYDTLGEEYTRLQMYI